MQSQRRAGAQHGWSPGMQPVPCTGARLPWSLRCMQAPWPWPGKRCCQLKRSAPSAQRTQRTRHTARAQLPVAWCRAFVRCISSWQPAASSTGRTCLSYMDGALRGACAGKSARASKCREREAVQTGQGRGRHERARVAQYSPPRVGPSGPRAGERAAGRQPQASAQRM